MEICGNEEKLTKRVMLGYYNKTQAAHIGRSKSELAIVCTDTFCPVLRVTVAITAEGSGWLGVAVLYDACCLVLCLRQQHQ